MKIVLFGLSAIFAIIVLGVVLGAFGVLGTYNELVGLKQDTDSQWAEVQNQYQRRFDLIPNLVSTVQGAANFEKSTFIGVAQARASVGQLKIDVSHAPQTAVDLQKFDAAQGQLTQALSHLMVITENYPNLQSNQNFLELQSQLEGTENRITTARERFNNSTQSYNTALKTFPTVLYAASFGFTEHPYFQAKDGTDVAPSVKFQ